MKNKFKILIVIILLFNLTNAISQVTGNIGQVYVNGVAIPNGTPINLGISTSTRVKFRVSFTKPNGYVVGNTKFSIKTFSSNGYSKTYNNINATTFWADNSSELFSWFEYDFLASDFYFSESCYLIVNLQQTTGATSNWSSNTIKVIKYPNYTGIVQIPSGIPCNSNSIVTYYLDSDDLVGYSLLQWTYGSTWQIANSSPTAGISLFH